MYFFFLLILLMTKSVLALISFAQEIVLAVISFLLYDLLHHKYHLLSTPYIKITGLHSAF